VKKQAEDKINQALVDNLAAAVVLPNHRWRDPLLELAAHLAVLVGEANPYGGRPGMALFPKPAGSSGDRLCRLVLGVDVRTYVRVFRRVNLCRRTWRLAEAREQAAKVGLEALRAGRMPMVLLGARVAQAFRVPYAPFAEGVWFAQGEAISVPYVSLPHPSGLCRAWNEPGAYERARAAVARLVGQEGRVSSL